MTIKVKIVHDRSNLTKEERKAFRKEARAALLGAAEILANEVRRRLRARSGPQPSPEGEAPAMQTGKLLRSYRRLPPRIRGDSASSGIISKHPGANRLEYGATDTRGVRTLPRPHVRPALSATEGPISEYLAKRFGGSPE